MKTKKQSQTFRIFSYLFDHMGEEIPAVTLHQIGSNKPNGFCASLSRRISDIRDAGYEVYCRRETQPDGVVHTYYTMGTKPQ